MRAMTILTCRGGEVTLLSRARAPAELCSVLPRRGAPRTGASSSAPTFTSWASVQRVVTVCSAVGSEASQEPTAPSLTIRIPYRVNFGEVLRVVGSSSLLGNWSADRGLQLTWTDGDVWTAEVPVNAGHYEFKCVVYNVTTSSVTRWEDGGNRVLDITADPGAWDVSCQWGATADMTQAFTSAAPPPPPAEPEAASAEVTAAEDVLAEFSGGGLQTFLALEPAPDANQTDEAGWQEGDAAATAAVAPAGASRPADAEAAASPSGGGGGAVMLLLATCAAGVVAAAAFLAPGGLEASALGGKASQAVSSTLEQSSSLVRDHVQSQLAALAGQVSAVGPQVPAAQPAVRPQMAAAGAGAVTGTADLGSRSTARQG